MGGPGAGAGEKAKDFNSAIKRLFSELHGFKAVILVALILAIAGSILSISAPNILSDLTDEISTGLVVNKDNMQELSSKITENFSQEKMADVMPKILQMNLSKDSITQIMSSQDISTEDKQKFQDVIKQSSESEKQDELFKSIAQLPESILNIILPNSTYEGKEISSKDKIELLTLISQMQDGEKNANITIPESMKDILFSEFEIDGTKISTDDQYKYITEMSTLTEGTSASELYAKIDKMPESIQKVVKPFMNIDKIKKITLILVCIYLASALCTYIQSISMTIVANKFAKGLRSRISTKINKLPLKYFDRHQTGDILSRVTNANPKIANYHFTTLNPNLGVVDMDGSKGFVIADIPGIIEGASEGVGLGFEFLRHIERTKVMIHMVDGASVEGRDPIVDIHAITDELKKYNKEILEKPQVIAANKMDAMSETDRETVIDLLKEEFEPEGIKVFPISAVSGEGVKELLWHVQGLLDELPEGATEFEQEYELNFGEEEGGIFIGHPEEGLYTVEGPKVERMLGYTNLESERGFDFFQKFMKENGVIERLTEMGIEEGDTVRLYNLEFDYYR